MGWRTIVVNNHCKLSYKNNHLIYKDVDRTEMLHLSEIDILLLETTDITISTMLLKRLIDENILVIFCDDKRLPIANVTPYYGCHNSTLQLNKQVNWLEGTKGVVWTKIIAQKIMNQIDYLNELGFTDKASAIFKLYNELEIFDPSNREGHAARSYFNCLFGTKFSREDNNDINAALDYGYSLLLSMVAREVVITGCMTQFGLKHSNQFNSYNLASDIMEPFRIIIDKIVYDNINKEFKEIKKQLFKIFTETYKYMNKDMYLNNIISDYVKKVIKSLNNEGEGVPVFRI